MNEISISNKNDKYSGSFTIEDWHWQLKNRISSIDQLQKYVNLTVDEKRAITYSKTGKFKTAITPYFASLIDKNNPDCPIRKQCIPTLDEFRTSVNELSDPCGEEKNVKTPGLVHRYPDRVLLLITDMCAMYCRHCTRRRMVGSSEAIMTNQNFESAIKYISENKKIRDVLISGGDPLVLPDDKLDYYLSRIRKIDHVEIIRIGTRVPITLPQRITSDLCSILKKYRPLYMSIHVNHPDELTGYAGNACNMLSEHGIPLGSQTVLLKGINDKPATMITLMHELLKNSIRPYYIYQCDLAQGTEHFRTSVATGVKIMSSLRGYTTGYAVPTFVIDTPGGGGKIPVNPDYIISKNRNHIIIKNFEGKVFVYPEKYTPDSILKKQLVKVHINQAS